MEPAPPEVPASRRYDPTAWERFADIDVLRALYESTGWTGYRLRNRRAIEEVLAELPPGSRVLDVACFVGLYSEVVVAGGGRYVGSDVTPKFIASAGRRHGISSYVVADLHWLPFRKQAFDLVFNFGTLIHLPEPRLPLTELWRVTRTTLLVETSTVEGADDPVDLVEEGDHFLSRAYGLSWFDGVVRSLPGRVSGPRSEPWRVADSAVGPLSLDSSLWRIDRSA